MKAVKTEVFSRIRIGISRAGPKGSVKKPSGDKLINDFIISPFKPAEQDVLKTVLKKVSECLETAITDSPEKAMGELNASFNK